MPTNRNVFPKAINFASRFKFNLSIETLRPIGCLANGLSAFFRVPTSTFTPTFYSYSYFYFYFYESEELQESESEVLQESESDELQESESG
ncbi:hypothetical protein ElyMa_004641400 [Elysia marginata]|uniref:Uncharacterized protein n=1 Tax=Elysia marginata TaxID=1093978 RepID=A0AAV4HZX5_9GAST|nr:hypothetical protein ElyMa_004641400 [Elysia marginata]